MCSRVHISVMIRMHTSNLHVGHVSGLRCIWHCRTPSLRTSPACAYMCHMRIHKRSLSLSHTFTSFTHMRMYVCIYIYACVYIYRYTHEHIHMGMHVHVQTRLYIYIIYMYIYTPAKNQPRAKDPCIEYLPEGCLGCQGFCLMHWCET